MVDDKYVLFYDGECLFCQAWVRFLIRRDQDDLFRFSALQSPLGQRVLAQHQIPSDLSTIVMVHDQKIYMKSDVPLTVSSLLDFPYKILSYLKWVPKFIRDWAYGLFAKYRYKIWGKSTACDIPEKDIMYKFI